MCRRAAPYRWKSANGWRVRGVHALFLDQNNANKARQCRYQLFGGLLNPYLECGPRISCAPSPLLFCITRNLVCTRTACTATPPKIQVGVSRKGESQKGRQIANSQRHTFISLGHLLSRLCFVVRPGLRPPNHIDSPSFTFKPTLLHFILQPASPKSRPTSCRCRLSTLSSTCMANL